MSTTSLSKSRRQSNPSNGKSGVDNSQNYTCVVAKGTTIEGNFSSTEPVRLDGSVMGDLECSDKLVIGPEGKVEGNVKARHIIVKGKIEGDVLAEEHLHLFATAIVKGAIQAGHFSVEEGAIFNGESKVQGKKS